MNEDKLEEKIRTQDLELDAKQEDEIKYGLLRFVDRPTHRGNNSFCKFLLNNEYYIHYADLDSRISLRAETTRYNEELFLTDDNYPPRISNFTLKPPISVSQIVYDDGYAYTTDFCNRHNLLNKFYYYTVTEYGDYLGYEEKLQEFVEKAVAYRCISYWRDNLDNIYIKEVNEEVIKQIV